MGNLVKKARKERKITQGDLARKIGISRATLINIEKGRFGSVSFIKILSILRSVGYDLKVERFNPFKKKLDMDN